MKQKPFRHLIQPVSGLKFLRNKKPVKDKVVSALLYGFGLSSRKTKTFVKASHVSVLDWHRRLSRAIGKTQPECREAIAVDETKLKVNGERVLSGPQWVLKQILGVKATAGRSSLETYISSSLREGNALTGQN